MDESSSSLLLPKINKVGFKNKGARRQYPLFKATEKNVMINSDPVQTRLCLHEKRKECNS